MGSVRVCVCTFGFTFHLGIIFGLVIKYIIPPTKLARYEVVVADPGYTTCNHVQDLLSSSNGKLEELHGHITGEIRYAIGEKIVIRGYSFEHKHQMESVDQLICQISGRAFTSEEGNPLQQSVSGGNVHPTSRVD